MSGLEIFGAVVLGIVALLFPRLILGLVIMLLLEFPLLGLIPLAIVGGLFDLAALSKD